MRPSTRFLKWRLLLLRRVRAGDSVSCGWCLCGCLAFCCFHATLPRNLRQLQPRMPSDLGRNSHDAETAQIAPRQQKRPNQPRSRNGFVSVWPEAASHPKRFRPKQPRRRHSPETASSCLANPPRTSLRSPCCLTTCLLALTCLLGYLRFCLLASLLTHLLSRLLLICVASPICEELFGSRSTFTSIIIIFSSIPSIIGCDRYRMLRLSIPYTDICGCSCGCRCRCSVAKAR